MLYSRDFQPFKKSTLSGGSGQTQSGGGGSRARALHAAATHHTWLHGLMMGFTPVKSRAAHQQLAELHV